MIQWHIYNLWLPLRYHSKKYFKHPLKPFVSSQITLAHEIDQIRLAESITMAVQAWQAWLIKASARYKSKSKNGASPGHAQSKIWGSPFLSLLLYSLGLFGSFLASSWYFTLFVWDVWNHPSAQDQNALKMAQLSQAIKTWNPDTRGPVQILEAKCRWTAKF